MANVPPMTVETALDLGRAVAFLFRNDGHQRRIVVGKDTRRSCYMFETALAAGICSMGADCWLCGPLPTPGVAHLTSSMRAEAGVVISASHNPYQDNGIKIFAADGFKLPDARELEIEAAAGPRARSISTASPAHQVGRVTRIPGVDGRYIAFLKHTFPPDLTLDGIRIVVDCANGAAYRLAPVVFEELGAEVVSLGVQPNGRNINDGCGALHPGQVQRAVIEHGAQLGVALDGDADRVIIVRRLWDQVVDGDAILLMLARRMLAPGRLAHHTVVATVMCNLGLERALRGLGGEVERVQVGDRYVVERMREGGFVLGGEQSGHIVMTDFASTGDGLMAALQILAQVVETGKPLAELAAGLEPVPQVLEGIKVSSKPPIESLETVMAAIQDAERAVGDGRVLVRYSGTEKKCRVMLEGDDGAVLRAHADAIVAAIRREIGA